MIKVMLVDDEYLIRQGLKVIIDWSAYGYEIAAEASNGREALMLLQETRIDMMIIDVNMPEMSGMELIQEVKTQGFRQMQFVILSGHAEFEYARAAIGLGVRDYILKPIQSAELGRLLVRMNKSYQEQLVQQEREHERLRIEYMMRASNVLRNKYTQEDLTYMKERLLDGDVGSVTDEEGAAGIWSYVSFEFDENDAAFAALGCCERTELQQECTGCLERLVAKYPYHVIASIDQEECVFGAGLFYTPGLSKCTGHGGKDYIAALHKQLSMQFSYKIQVFIGAKVQRLEDISESLQAVRVARCLHQLGDEKKIIVFCEEVKSCKASGGIRNEDMEGLLDAAKHNEPDQIKTYTARIYVQIRENALSVELVKANIYYLFYCLMELAKEVDDELSRMEVLQYITKESFDQLILSGSEKELSEFICSYARYLAELREKDSRGVLDKVEEYVRLNYHEPLTLKLLGEKFYINNVYLGQLFKKQYGSSFKEYLNRLRIEIAAEILDETELRVYAVAEKVGFQNPDYFINKFVQIKGITPNQYRRKLWKA